MGNRHAPHRHRESGDEGSDVMISYVVRESGALPHGDGTVALLESGLRERGYSVFVGENSLEVGDAWADQIQRAITCCSAILVVCSPSFSSTDWTRREIILASNLHKPLFPIWHSGVYPPPGAALLLSGLQRLPSGMTCLTDLRASRSFRISGLLDELVEKFISRNITPSGRRPAPGPAPPGPDPRVDPTCASASTTLKDWLQSHRCAGLESELSVLGVSEVEHLKHLTREDVIGNSKPILWRHLFAAITEMTMPEIDEDLVMWMTEQGLLPLMDTFRSLGLSDLQGVLLIEEDMVPSVPAILRKRLFLCQSHLQQGTNPGVSRRVNPEEQSAAPAPSGSVGTGEQRSRDVTPLNTDIVLSPLVGLSSRPFLPLIEAVAPTGIKNIREYVFTALATFKSYDGALSLKEYQLSPDEAAAIRLYTMEWNDGDSLYKILNSKLRSANRSAIKPFFDYLKLLLSALEKLPHYSGNLYRGLKVDVSEGYKTGETMYWWGFSSCTDNLAILESPQFCGTSGPRTILQIKALSAINISRFSMFHNESEILLLPGTYLEVGSVVNLGSGLSMVELKELKTELSLMS